MELAPSWHFDSCGDFRASPASWLARDCLSWVQGDWQFERTVANDLLEAGLARCFHVNVGANFDMVFAIDVDYGRA